MKTYRKRNVATNHARRFLEPGPIVLVSSRYKDQMNIMTMGWHVVLETSPAIIAGYIWDQDDSRELIRKSKACVINIPEAHLARTVVKIGNVHSQELKADKFSHFGLTPQNATHVEAPLIKECYANLECKLIDTSLAKKYSLFVFEIVKIHAAATPKNPKTIHYQGKGQFMVAGGQLNLAKLFRPGALQE